MRWWRRLVPVVAVGALLAMHGLDPASTAAHASHAPALHVDGPVLGLQDPMDPTSSHVVGACAAMLLVAFGAVLLRRLHSMKTGQPASGALPAPLAQVLVLGRPPPVPRYALAVIRR